MAALVFFFMGVYLSDNKIQDLHGNKKVALILSLAFITAVFWPLTVLAYAFDKARIPIILFRRGLQG
jgi:hypothetical protein